MVGVAALAGAAGAEGEGSVSDALGPGASENVPAISLEYWVAKADGPIPTVPERWPVPSGADMFISTVPLCEMSDDAIATTNKRRKKISTRET